MIDLEDYLDFNLIRVFCANGKEYEGWPIVVNDAEDNESGEDELAIETKPGHIVGLRESEIARIDVVKE